MKEREREREEVRRSQTGETVKRKLLRGRNECWRARESGYKQKCDKRQKKRERVGWGERGGVSPSLC